jgi:hypothetical protein
MAAHQRGVTVHFTDGTRLSLSFPKQTESEVAARFKLDDVLKKRYVLFEADETLLLIPFENVKYLQLYPAPGNVPGHTYIKDAILTG